MRDFNWLISGVIEPFNWFADKSNTSRLVSSPICGGISPYNLLDDRSRRMSLDRLLISTATVPKSSFMLRLRNARFGRDENENPWSVPFKPELARFNLLILPAWLLETPNQLHGVELVFWLFEELVALLGRVAFQLSRASASSFKEREVTSNEECNMANTTIETRENTFFKKDIAMVLFLQVANWFSALYLNVSKLPPFLFSHTIYRLKIWVSPAIILAVKEIEIDSDNGSMTWLSQWHEPINLFIFLLDGHHMSLCLA